jgi:hypothetical protein
MYVKGLRYSTTLENLRSALANILNIEPLSLQILKAGQRLAPEHCTLTYFGISNKQILEVIRNIQQNNVNNKIKIRIRRSMR